MEIDMSKPKEEILRVWVNHIKSKAPELSDEEAMKFAKKTMPYLNCPADNGNRVLPMACMFCSYGHCTECHFPLTCSEAECSHYQRDNPDYLEYPNQEDEEEY